jgi:hypothetical protein
MLWLLVAILRVDPRRWRQARSPRPLQELGSKLVEPGTAHPGMRGCSGGVKRTRAEVVEDAPDEADGLAVN